MIYYIGGFPPPYGGVTVKNNILYAEIEKLVKIRRTKIKKIDTQRAKMNPILLLQYLCILLFCKNGSFIIATAGKNRKNISNLLSSFNKNLLSSSILIVMGGVFAQDIEGDIKYLRSLKEYKKIYVETGQMKLDMEKYGFNNIDIYPNCRKVERLKWSVNANLDKPLRCLFFSLISPEKGVDLILEAAKKLHNIQFDFWGEIKVEYKAEFMKSVNTLENVNYNGVFKVKGENIYHKINEYDMLLLPTKFKTEGVPGILVESKIAAVPSIVSDVSYNSEIVEHGVSGIVLRDNNTDSLIESIQYLNADRQMITNLKANALKSAQYYLVDNYIDYIIADLKTKNN